MHIIISCGDIEGIGLECLFAAITRNEHTCSLTVEHTLSIAVNDESLNQCIDLLPSVRCKVTNNSIQFHNGTVLNIIPCQTHALPRWNGPTGDSTRLAIESLEVAADYLKSGRADAVLTLPIAKDTMQDAGWHFPGQTEFFASVAGVSRPMMILFSGSVRVALATIHIPISKVSESLSVNGISDSVTLLAKTLTRDFGIASPRIAVLGVNPHAGEQGTIGTEERDILIPAVDSVRKEGIDADGPFPADGFFAHGAFRNYDGILAMYHDQGLIPLKLLAEGGGVNFTAGLPFVRTSPDHGTAYGIAGKGIANPQSTWDALSAAVLLTEHRRGYHRHSASPSQ